MEVVAGCFSLEVDAGGQFLCIGGARKIGVSTVKCIHPWLLLYEFQVHVPVLLLLLWRASLFVLVDPIELLEGASMGMFLLLQS